MGRAVSSKILAKLATNGAALTRRASGRVSLARRVRVLPIQAR